MILENNLIIISRENRSKRLPFSGSFFLRRKISERAKRHPRNSKHTILWILRFGEIKDGPTTPLCAILFVHSFFSFIFVPPPPSPPPSRFSTSFYFLSFFFQPLFWIGWHLDLHCLETFVCAVLASTCVTLVFFCCFPVGHNINMVFSYYFLFVHLFCRGCITCSVLCLIVKNGNVHPPPPAPTTPRTLRTRFW